MKSIVISNNCIIYNDMPYGWVTGKNQPLWHSRVYSMWRHMWQRVYKDIDWFGSLILPRFAYLSEYVSFIESQSTFELFKTTCHEVRWSIDKDMKCSGNRNYYPEFMTLCTISDNTKELMNREDYKLSPKMSIIGINIDNNLIILLNSISSSAQFGFNPSAISRCCRGKKPQYKGYIWKYL